MIDEVERIVGRDAVWPLSPDGEVARKLGVPAVAAARPPDEETFVEVLRLAGRRRYVSAAWGAGEAADGGPAPRRPDLLLLTEALAGVVHFDPDDETITVRSGTPLSELARTIEGTGLALPFDVPPGSRETIGGFLAAGRRTALVTGVGPPRDHLLGVRFALPRFGVVRSGGRLVKNVTGYDLFRIHLGARGAFGLLLEVSLRLRPAPEAGRTLVAHFGDEEALAGFLQAVRPSGRGGPQRLRLAPAATWSRVAGEDAPGGGGVGFTVLVDLEGLPRHVDARVREAQEAARRCGGSVEALPPEARAALVARACWPRRWLGVGGEAELEIRHPVRRTGLWHQPGLMDALAALGAAHDVEIALLGDPLVGRLAAYAPAAAPEGFWIEAIDLVGRAGGRARFASAPCAVRRACAAPLAGQRPLGERRIYERLRRALDPDGVLDVWSAVRPVEEGKA